MPRTVMFALAAQGEYLLLLKSSLAALANLLCLGADHGPLPRLGICALEIAAKTGKVQLKVRKPWRNLLQTLSFDFFPLPRDEQVDWSFSPSIFSP